MIELFTAPDNLLFTIAVGLVVLFSMIQILGLLVGLELFSFMDSWTPDLDLDLDLDADIDMDLDLDVDVDVGGDIDLHADIGALTTFLSWFGIGKVPIAISLCIFLFSFGSFGLITQSIFHSIGVGYLHFFIVFPGAFALALLVMRSVNKLCGRLFPKDEDTAVSVKTFIGRVATITLGTATDSMPAEAKLRDSFGNTHYIMVFADNEDEEFEQGEHVLVVGSKGAHFSVIKNDNPKLE